MIVAEARWGSDAEPPFLFYSSSMDLAFRPERCSLDKILHSVKSRMKSTRLDFLTVPDLFLSIFPT
jgi:hypothetical protein